MIRTKITVAGSLFEDYQRMYITRSTSSNTAVSNYWVELDSPYGRHKNDFTVGNQIKIFADKDTAPVTNIFTALVEGIEYMGDGLNETVRLRGRDYTSVLLDNTIQPVVYTNTEIGSIVKDILKNNTTTIGSANVGTTLTILPRIAFNNIPIYDGLKQLADIANYTFFVDNNVDLNFVPTGSTVSNATFNSGNLIKVDLDKTREGMANKIWVYGDRVLNTAPVQILTVGSPTGGSVYSLTYNPFNLQVSILGSVKLGGVFNNQVNAASGNAYLLSFNDKTLVFPSGTVYGYYLPPSGGSIVATYDRQVPIVKYGESQASIQAFGAKSLVIDDKSIKDPQTATSILNSKLVLVNPLNSLDLTLQGWFTFTPNQTAIVNIPDFNLNKTMSIIEMRYQFDKDTVNSEQVISTRMDNRPLDLTDTIRNLNRRMIALEAQDKQSTDVITRLQYGLGSLVVVGSYWEVRTRYLGSDFRVWPSSNVPPMGSNFTPRLGLLNSGAGLNVGSMSYLVSGALGGTAFVATRSGGYSY